MNERITELMIDAGKTIPGEKHIDADFCNKFAELIVGNVFVNVMMKIVRNILCLILDSPKKIGVEE